MLTRITKKLLQSWNIKKVIVPLFYFKHSDVKFNYVQPANRPKLVCIKHISEVLHFKDDMSVFIAEPV